MSAILLAVAVATAAAEEPRAFHDISRQLDGLLRSEALAKTPQAQERAVRQMCSLYTELLRDERMTTSPTLQGYKAKLWRRLTNVRREIERKIAQRERLGQRGQSNSEIAAQREAQQSADEAARLLAEQVNLVNYSLGGPGKVFADGGGAFGGGPVRDLGDDLVRLIEHTIAPDFWDTNGGPGSIFYYAPLQALVVRATDGVHRKIGGVVGGLRAAGP